jgi:hypothetical protein
MHISSSFREAHTSPQLTVSMKSINSFRGAVRLQASTESCPAGLEVRFVSAESVTDELHGGDIWLSDKLED